MADAKSLWPIYLGSFGLMSGIAYTMIAVANASNISGKGDVVSAITTIVVVNGALCLTLAGTGYFSVNSSSIMKRPYVYVLLHATIIIALIGMGITALTSLGIDPTTLKPVDSKATTTVTDPDYKAIAISALVFGSIAFVGMVGLGYMYWRASNTTR